MVDLASVMRQYVLHAMIPVNLALRAWVLVGRAIC
jgi:hypothetical protein